MDMGGFLIVVIMGVALQIRYGELPIPAPADQLGKK